MDKIKFDISEEFEDQEEVELIQDLVSGFEQRDIDNLRTAISNNIERLECQGKDSNLRDFALFEYIDKKELGGIDFDINEFKFVKFKNLKQFLSLLKSESA